MCRQIRASADRPHPSCVGCGRVRGGAGPIRYRPPPRRTSGGLRFWADGDACCQTRARQDCTDTRSSAFAWVVRLLPRRYDSCGFPFLHLTTSEETPVDPVPHHTTTTPFLTSCPRHRRPFSQSTPTARWHKTMRLCLLYHSGGGSQPLRSAPENPHRRSEKHRVPDTSLACGFICRYDPHRRQVRLPQFVTAGVERAGACP